MYIPSEFKIDDRQTIDDFLQQHSFGILTAQSNGKLTASHLPFLMEKEGETYVFYTHIANENELSKIADGSEVLLMFTGEHGYISSSWYGHPNVPTWNYQAVHIYGKIEKQITEELYIQLRKLTKIHEDSVDGHIDPETLPPRMVESYLQFISGFKITVTKIEAAFKLSQNRNPKDFEMIQERLRNINPTLSEVMEEFYPKSRD
jgi:transcriptional regulator